MAIYLAANCKTDGHKRLCWLHSQSSKEQSSNFLQNMLKYMCRAALVSFFFLILFYIWLHEASVAFLTSLHIEVCNIR